MPFLDHHVVELAWQLPLHMRIGGCHSKRALRQVFYKYVPGQLIERPKAGFGIRVGQCLRGPLRDWAANLLEESRLEREGYLNRNPIRETLETALERLVGLECQALERIDVPDVAEGGFLRCGLIG